MSAGAADFSRWLGPIAFGLLGFSAACSLGGEPAQPLLLRTGGDVDGADAGDGSEADVPLADAPPDAPDAPDAAPDDADAAPDAPSCEAPQRWYADRDEDGFGDPARALDACEAPSGYIERADDCDDFEPAVHPGAAEACDGVVDDDCDGLIDEGPTWYPDRDHDGFGLAALGVASCAAPEVDFILVDGDCDDTRSEINPGASEVCDGVDNDCDDQVDDADESVAGLLTWAPDDDLDGYGVAADAIETCEPPSGWVDLLGDCDDARSEVKPGASEVCDGLDNDCDGVTDPDDTGCASGTVCDEGRCRLPLGAACAIGQACVQGTSCARNTCMPAEVAPAVVGHWCFDDGDLSAAVGPALAFRSDSTRDATRFGTTEGFGISGIQGIPVPVMFTPATDPTQGFILDHGIAPQRGEQRVNQYSFVFDVYYPGSTENRWRVFYQTNPDNTEDGDFFVYPNGDRGIGINGRYEGRIQLDTWHRVVVVVDLTHNNPKMIKYIDGQRVGAQDNVHDVDQRFALLPRVLLFTDENRETSDTFVACIQLRNYPMNDGEVARLGAPAPEGISLEVRPD